MIKTTNVHLIYNNISIMRIFLILFLITFGESKKGRGDGRGEKCNCGIPNRAAVAEARPGPNENRIIGGQDTEENEYPWQVALVTPGTTDTTPW